MSEEFNNLEEIKKLLNTFTIVDYTIEYSENNEYSYLQFYNNKYNLLNYDILKNKDIKNANVFERSLIEDKLITNTLLKYLSKGYNLGIVKGKNTFYNFEGCSVEFLHYFGDGEETINKCIEKIADYLNQVYITICLEIENTLNLMKKGIYRKEVK